MSRTILHVDCDCFFASVEMRENEQYRDLPLAVGGSPEGRGVISACNYPAREYGVRSAMPSWKALQLCPSLTLVKGNMSLYQHVSAEIMAILKGYSRRFEPVSIDEAYLELMLGPEEAEKTAEQIRSTVWQETGIRVSIGVASNKFLAKIASDWNKPDGLMVITSEDLEPFLCHLPLSRIPGVGPKMTEKLERDGYRVCGDLRPLSLPKLVHRYGKMGLILHQRCRGVDDRSLKQTRERQSVGLERTFARDLKNMAECQQQLPELWDGWLSRVHSRGCERRLMSPYVKIRFSDFSVISHSVAREQVSYDGFERLMKHVLRQKQQPVRLIGLGARLSRENPQQPDLFDVATEVERLIVRE